MEKTLLQSVVLLFLCTMVYFVSRFNKNELPGFVIKEIVAQCEFDQPSHYRPGPYKRGIKWCNSGKPMETYRLITHLKQFSTGMDIVFAAEFGSDVKIAYIPKRDMVLINPAIVTTSVTTIWCEDDVGGVHIRKQRGDGVDIAYIDETLRKREARFERGDACRIQTLIEVI